MRWDTCKLQLTKDTVVEYAVGSVPVSMPVLRINGKCVENLVKLTL